MNKTRLLFINFEFPPLNKAGIFRVLNFIRHLDKNKFDIQLICFSDLAIQQLFKEKDIDYALLHLIPKNVKVHRIIDSTDLNLFSKYTLNKILKKQIIRKRINQIVHSYCNEFTKKDYLIVSVPYFGSAFLGIELKSKLSCHLLLDLRDEWSHFPTLYYKNYFYYLLKLLEEKYALFQADSITTVSQPLKRRYIGRHKYIQNKIHYIPNSFALQNQIRNEKVNASDHVIRIGYTGSFYYDPQIHYLIKTPFYRRSLKDWLLYSPLKEDWTYRTPFYFLQILKKILNQNPELNVEFHHIGNVQTWFEKMITNLNMNDITVLHGRQTKTSVLNIQKTWSAFLITAEAVEKDEHYCIPSKIFDYIQYDIPIIGAVTEGPVKKLIEDANLGIVIDPLQYDKEYKKLEHFILQLNKYQHKLKLEALTVFDIRNTTKKLENILLNNLQGQNKN